VTERAASGRESFPGFRLTLSIATISRSIAPHFRSQTFQGPQPTVSHQYLMEQSSPPLRTALWQVSSLRCAGDRMYAYHQQTRVYPGSTPPIQHSIQAKPWAEYGVESHAEMEKGRKPVSG